MHRDLAFGQCLLLLAQRRQAFQLLQGTHIRSLRIRLQVGGTITRRLGGDQRLGVKWLRQNQQHGIQPSQRLP